METIKIFLVDSSNSSILILKKIFSNADGIEVIGIAQNEESAIKMIPEAGPNVVILDIEMPGKNGIDLIKHLVRHFPIPILVHSSLTDKGAAVTNQALMEGAIDFINKPQSIKEYNKIAPNLIEKIKILSKVEVIKKIDIPHVSGIKRKTFKRPHVEKIIVIGVSTGGPGILRYLCSKLPENINFPIAIAQHMPKKFTTILAEQLNKLSPYPVKEAKNGEKLLNETIYLAPGGQNLEITQKKSFFVSKGTQIALPSIDILFESAAEIFQDRAIGIILSGMGNDGLEGAKRIKQKGGKIISQDIHSAIIPGMPGAIIENNLADKIAPLEKIPGLILNC